MLDRYTATVLVTDPRRGDRAEFAAALIAVAAAHRHVLGRPAVKIGFASYAVEVQVNGFARAMAFERTFSLVTALNTLAPARLLSMERAEERLLAGAEESAGA